MTTTTTTTPSCPQWCSVDHSTTETEGGHELVVAEFTRGDVVFCRQPWGDHEVQVWLDGNDSIRVPGSRRVSAGSASTCAARWSASWSSKVHQSDRRPRGGPSARCWV